MILWPLASHIKPHLIKRCYTGCSPTQPASSPPCVSAIGLRCIVTLNSKEGVVKATCYI